MHQSILIVGDSGLSRQALRELLGDGYGVLEAADATQAQAVLWNPSARVAAVLLRLAGADGLPALALLCGDARVNRTPVVVAADGADGAAEAEALSLGASDFIALPCAAEVLRLRLRGAIASAERARELRCERESLRISEELYRVAARAGGAAVARYDIKTGEYHTSEPTLLSLGCAETTPDVPQAFLERGLIAPECEADYLDFYDRVRRGERMCVATTALVLPGGAYRWFRRAATVLYDDDGQPAQAVITLEDVTRRRENEAAAERRRQALRQKPPESYALFRCDLVKDDGLAALCGDLLRLRPEDASESLNDAMLAYASHGVHQEDREAYLAAVDADALLAGHLRGARVRAADYREIPRSGAVRWLRLTVETAEDPDGPGVLAYLLYENVDGQKTAELKTREKIETDPLTGILNRDVFARRADRVLSGAKGAQHALMVMNVDGFKRLNDALGRAAGDEALVEIANSLRAALRHGDLLGRSGGDEYVVFMRGIPCDAVAEKKARQLCAQARKVFSADVRISASIGVAVYPRDGEDFDALYRRADAALHTVKGSGKDGFAFYDGGMDRPAGRAMRPAREPPPVIGAPSKRRILIADESAANRKALAAIVEEDYRVKMAADGDTALLLLRHYGTGFSAMILNLALPGPDGYALLEKMGADAEMRAIPVIAVGADDERDAALRAIQCGAADYVALPADPDLVRLRVQAAVAKSENERLRAQTGRLLMRSNEEAKYRTVLDSTGTVVIECDWVGGAFTYDASIGERLAGRYDDRKLWQILMSDMVADMMDVKAMQELVHAIADDRDRRDGGMMVLLRTPSGQRQWFRMRVFKRVNEFQLTRKMIITYVNINDEVLADQRLRYQAERDELTGLYNRAAFFEKAAGMIAAHEPGYYVMVCFDVNNFKVINDQYGSARGDDVLRRIAAVFAEGFDKLGGLACRIMADNFALLYPFGAQGSPQLAAMREAASVLDGTLPPVTASIGRYVIDDLTLPVSAMYDRAALAKASVKGRYDANIAQYDDSMLASLLREQEIVNEMNPALASRQFEVWFQPQYNHATKALIGAEALVRWRHPVRGVVPPAAFIPIFERNGFIYELDKYVWRQVCALLRAWLNGGGSPLPVSVNISRYDLFREDLIPTILGLMREYDLPIDLMRLEITESAFARSTEQIVRVVKQLIGYGFTVEVDDFGSGYSSLNTLKDVPAQVLKLDMRFLENGDGDDRGGNILESVVRMAKWLGMTVIAEGVETLRQADYLKSIGCAYVQGYLYFKPMRAEQYAALAQNAGREEKLLALQMVENLNNNALWDPKSMDTLVFNSYVGGAAIAEYHNGAIELLRASDKFVRMLGASMTVEDALRLDWTSRFAKESLDALADGVARSIQTRDEVNLECVLMNLPGCPPRTHLRIGLRVVAATGDRCLLYCTNENITAQRETERRERAAAERLRAAGEQLQFLNDTAGELLGRADAEAGVRRMLKKVQAFFGGDRAFVYEYRYDEGLCVYTYEARAAGAKACPKKYERFPLDTAWYWLRSFKSARFFTIDDAERLGEDRAPEREVLRALGARTALAVSLPHGGKVIGTLGVFNPTLHLRDHENLRALGDYMAIILTRRDLNAKIKSDGKAMRTMMEDTPGGFARLRFMPDGSIMPEYVNDNFCRLFGMSREDVMAEKGRDMLKRVHPDDVQTVCEAVAETQSTGRTISARYRARLPDGGYIPLSVFARTSVNEDGARYINVYYGDLTEREKKALSVRETIPYVLSTILASSREIAFAKDKEYRFICCSAAFARFAGREDEKDVVGRTDYELFSREVADQIRGDDRRLMDTGGPLLDYIEALPSATGALRYFKMSKYVLRDALGNVLGLYGAGREITEEREAYARLKLLTNSIPGGIATYVCAAGVIRLAYYNDTFCRMFGYTRREFDALGDRSATSLVFPEDLPRIQRQIDALVRDGTPIDCNCRTRRKDGGYLWLSIRGELSERHGDTVVFSAVLYDITERVEAENRLRISEEQFRLAAQIGGRHIARYDIRGGVYRHNTEALREMGFGGAIPDMPRALVDCGVIAPECVAEYYAFFDRLGRGEKECRADCALRLRDGRYLWFRAEATTLFDADNAPSQAIIVATDITEQREKEAAFQRLRQSLRQRPPESYTYFRWNLNKEMLDYRADGTLVTVGLDMGNATLGQRMSAYARACVREEDREAYVAALNAQALLAGYRRGKRQEALEYREALPDGRAAWRRVSVELVEYPETGDVEAYLMFEDVDERKRAELRAMELAETDPLTGVWNRVAFAKRVRELFEARPAQRHALLLADVDGFKFLNDTLGHAAGDRALIDVAGALRSILRREDLLGRLGGDEFLICLADMPRDVDAAGKARRICELMRRTYGADVRISASVGVAVRPRDGEDFEALYRAADAAMYRVKNAGKDGFAFFGGEPNRLPEGEGEEGANA